MAFSSTGGAAFHERFAESKNNGARLLSNILADRLLVEGGLKAPRFWTGTIVAYPAPGSALGSTISIRDSKSHMRYTLECNGLKGEKGIALLLEEGTYDLLTHKGEVFFAPESNPIILPGFPQESGWFSMDGLSGIPLLGFGERRYLWRLSSETIVPAARENGAKGWAMRDIFLNQRPSARLASLSEQTVREMGLGGLIGPAGNPPRREEARTAQG